MSIHSGKKSVGDIIGATPAAVQVAQNSRKLSLEDVGKSRQPGIEKMALIVARRKNPPQTRIRPFLSGVATSLFQVSRGCVA